MRKSTWILKLSFLAGVLFLWTNTFAAGISETVSISCPGETDGQLSFTESLGASNTYLWSDPDGTTTSTLKKLGAGTYTVVVSGTDAGTYTYDLKDPISVTSSVVTYDNTTWGSGSSGCDGIISITTTGGTKSYQHIIYDVLTRSYDTITSDLSPLSLSNYAPGDYIIATTDAFGCPSSTPKITATVGAGTSESTESTVPASDTTYVCYKETAGSTVIPSSDDIYPVYAEFSGNDTIASDSAMYYVLDTAVIALTEYADSIGYIDSIDYWSIPVSNNTDTTFFLSKTAISSTSSLGVYTDLIILKESNLDYAFSDSVDILQLADSSYINYKFADTLITGTSTSLAVANLEPGFYVAYYWTSEKPLSKGNRGVWDILAPDNPVTINYTQDNILCFGATTGAITANAQGSWQDYGVPFESISISGPSTITPSSKSNDISASGLAAGIYTITATDVKGCSRNQTVAITQPDDSLYLSYDVTKLAKCPYSSDGEVTIHRIVGGTAPFTYSWDNGAYTTETASGLTAGDHFVEVIDNDGCTVSDSIYVNFTNKSCFYNIVTPNGDGYNDYFDLTDMCQNMQMTAKIFNEQGKLVVTLDETNPKWDAYDPSTPPTGPSSTYTAFIKLTKDGENIAEFGESFSVIYSK